MREQIYLEQIRKRYYITKKRFNRHKNKHISFYNNQGDSQRDNENEDTFHKKPTELCINLWLNCIIFLAKDKSRFVKVDNKNTEEDKNCSMSNYENKLKHNIYLTIFD